jgi:oligopeptide/dipeptide ABC transporter ATP-binding protein
MGLLPKTAQITGSIKYRDEEVLEMSPKRKRALRGQNIAMIFQDPMTAMNPVYTVGDQLAEAYRSHHRVERKVAMRKAAEMLDRVGIPQAKDRVRSYPHEFSGGMRQRAMIAMAIINNPDIIIADEPTTALDVTVQAQILETLIEVKDSVDAAVILITHDLGVVAGMAHKVLVMYAGRAVERADVDDIYRRPRMPYTAGLLGSIPALDSAGGRLHPITGAPPSLINLPPGCPFSPRCPLATSICQEQEPELMATDLPHHRAACHHWETLAEVAEPTLIFRSKAESV